MIWDDFRLSANQPEHEDMDRATIKRLAEAGIEVRSHPETIVLVIKPAPAIKLDQLDGAAWPYGHHWRIDLR